MLAIQVLKNTNVTLKYLLLTRCLIYSVHLSQQYKLVYVSNIYIYCVLYLTFFPSKSMTKLVKCSYLLDTRWSQILKQSLCLCCTLLFVNVKLWLRNQPTDKCRCMWIKRTQFICDTNVQDKGLHTKIINPLRVNFI